VSRGDISLFQRERIEIIKADEPLISAKGLHWQKPFLLANRGLLSDSAIWQQLKGRGRTVKFWSSAQSPAMLQPRTELFWPVTE
jgi:hypothetical protein